MKRKDVKRPPLFVESPAVTTSSRVAARYPYLSHTRSRSFYPQSFSQSFRVRRVFELFTRVLGVFLPLSDHTLVVLELVQVSLHVVDLRRRQVFPGGHVVARAFGDALHGPKDFLIVVVLDHDTFQALRFDIGIEPLDRLAE